MIVNVRMTYNHDYKVPILITSLMSTKNNSFNYSSLHFKLKPSKKLFPLLKEMLLSKKNINAKDFVETVVDPTTEKDCPPLLNKLVIAINNINTINSITISRLYINDRLLSRIKSINIINNVAYFVIRKHYSDKSKYILEPISNAKCVIPSSNFILIYKMVKENTLLSKKLGKRKPKYQFKKFRLNPYSTDLNSYLIDLARPHPPTHLEETPNIESEFSPTRSVQEISRSHFSRTGEHSNHTNENIYNSTGFNEQNDDLDYIISSPIHVSDNPLDSNLDNSPD